MSNEQDTFNDTSDEEYNEIVQDNLSEEKQDLIPEKGESETDDKETKEATEDVNPLDDNLITEEIAKEYGFDRKLIGKPLKEGFTAYKNLQSFDTKLSQQVADLTNKMSGLEEQLSKKEVKEAEKEVEEKLPDYETEIEKYIDDDGYVVDRKGFAKFNKDYHELSVKLKVKELEKKLDDNQKEFEEKGKPISDSVQELQKEKYQSDLYDFLSDGLAKLYDEVTPELIDETIKQYGKLLSEEDEETQKYYTAIYLGKPVKLAKDILTYHKANLNEKPKSEKEEAAEKAHKKQVKKLKNTDKTFIESAASGRQTEKDVKKEDKDYDDIIKEAMEDQEDRFSEQKKE
jgi:hypothetical protein